MHICLINSCDSRSNTHPHVSFFGLPKVPARFGKEYRKLLLKRRKAWFSVLKLDSSKLEKGYQNAKVCSKHFQAGKPSDFRDVNNVDWLPHVELDGRVVVSHGRPLKKRKLIHEELEESSQNTNDESSNLLDNVTVGNNTSTGEIGV